jgi:hypothetical protein
MRSNSVAGVLEDLVAPRRDEVLPAAARARPSPFSPDASASFHAFGITEGSMVTVALSWWNWRSLAPSG